MPSSASSSLPTSSSSHPASMHNCRIRNHVRGASRWKGRWPSCNSRSTACLRSWYVGRFLNTKPTRRADSIISYVLQRLNTSSSSTNASGLSTAGSSPLGDHLLTLELVSQSAPTACMHVCYCRCATSLFCDICKQLRGTPR